MSHSPRSEPLAVGQPISEAVATQAAEWLTLLMSAEATEADCQRWQRWRDANPDHERAWKHIEAVMGRLRIMEPKAAYKTLSPYSKLTSPRRRQVLRLLVWGGVLGVMGGVASRTQTWQTMTADYHTGTGEQRTVTLGDNTRILLNTASAIDVRFDEHRRLVRLVEGEIMIATGHALVENKPDLRPFIVQTGEGRIQALGTRFVVRQKTSRSVVAVLDGAVEIVPDEGAGEPRVLRIGESTTFTHDTVGLVSPVAEEESAWARGQIVADGVSLGDFLVDLARYRPGIVRCEASVANLRFSGVFPLGDTDRILNTLPTVLPVRVQRYTRYWVTVGASS